MAYADEVLADSPKAYLAFEGNITNQGSGGSMSGSVGSYVSGQTTIGGQAGSFTTNTVERTGSSASTFGGDSGITCEAWVKTTSTTLSSIMAVGNTGGSFYYDLRMNANGTVSFFRRGTNNSATSTATVNDGNWHHVVGSYSTASGTLKVYVDGVLSSISTSGGTGTINGNIYIGNAAGSRYFNGVIDEASNYSTQLSDTRVAAHYAAANGVSINVDVSTVTASTAVYAAEVAQAHIDLSTLTASADVVAVSAGGGITTDVSTVTASAAIEAVEVRKVSYNVATLDRSQDTGGTYYADTWDATLVPLNATNYRAYFAFGNPTDLLMPNLKAATLRVYASATVTVNVQRITSAMDASTSTIPPTVDADVVTVTLAAGSNDIDVSAIYDVAGYGYRLERTSGSANINSRTNGSNKPTLLTTYEVVPAGITLDVSTLTVAIQSEEVEVAAGTRTDVATVTASADIDAATVEVTTDPNIETVVGTVTASVQAYEAVASASGSLTADTVTASVGSHDVTVETTESALVDLDSAHTFVTRIGLTDVNGEPIVPTEDEDAFFNSTMFLNPHIWYRMDATSGTSQKPRAWFGATDDEALDGANPGAYHGVTIGLNEGPNGRRNVYFGGTDYFTAGEFERGGLGGETNSVDSTVEFSIRTTKANQFVMRIDDANYSPQQRYKAKDIYLKDGKVNFRVWAPNAQNDNVVSFDFVGRTNIADGEWHHIVLTNVAGTDQISDKTLEGFNIYVDGVLDLHRRYNIAVSFPDYIGGRPGEGGNDAMYAPLPVSDWFVGDLTEVVSFRYALNQDQIYRQNDTLFGYDPVYVDTLGVSVGVNAINARGNTKRVLAINLGARDGTLAGTTAEGNVSKVAFQGLSYAGSSLTNGVMAGGYQVFTADAYYSPVEAPGPLGKVWWEETYDVNRMLDLEKDLNLDDYDIITVVGYPTSGNDYDDLDRNFSDWSLFGGPSARQQLESLMAQVRDFAINGGGLYVTDPMTAKAVGVIDDFDMVDLLESRREIGFDYGNSGGDYDRRAAEINPWPSGGGNGGITNPRTPAYELKNNVDYQRIAHFYRDLHGNEWQTVRALVDGLTDVPGRIITDAVWFWPFRDDGDHYAEKSVKRDDGLTVGDTFPIMGTRGPGRGDQYMRDGTPVGLSMRIFGQVAAPVSAVKAGTVVTTFAPTYYKRVGGVDVLATNPYKDHAVTIVVRPGDTMNGEVVKGRIFVNFSEGYANLAPVMMHVPVDQVPSDVELAGTPYYETAESREWSYSSWRGGWASTNTGAKPSQNIVTIDQSGNVVINSGETDGVSGLTYTPRWEIDSEDAPTMHYRGLVWVGGGQDADGNATVGLATLDTAASVNAVTVEAAKSAEISVTTVEAVTEAWDDADTEGADVTVNLFTVAATANVEAYQEVVELDTPVAVVTSHDDADGVLASNDVIVLRLPRAFAILTLEDK